MKKVYKQLFFTLLIIFEFAFLKSMMPPPEEGPSPAESSGVELPPTDAGLAGDIGEADMETPPADIPGGMGSPGMGPTPAKPAPTDTGATPMEPAPTDMSMPSTLPTDEMGASPASGVAPEATTAEPTTPFGQGVELGKKTAEYQKDLEKLKADVEAIDQSETKILDQLRQLDDKLEAAIDESVNARKLSVDILNVADEAAATKNLNQLKESLKKVEAIRDEVQAQFTKSLNEALTSIDTQIQQAQQSIQALEQRGAEFELEEEVLPVVAEAEEEKVAAELVAKEVAQEPKSYWFQKGADAVAGTINFFKRTGKWISDVFKAGVEKSKQTKETATQATQPADVAEAMPAAPTPPPTPTPAAQPMGMGLPPGPETAMPGAPMGVESAATVADSLVGGVDTQIQDLESSIKKLEEEKKAIEEKRKEIEKLKAERLEAIRKKMARLEELSVVAGLKKTAGWRKIAEYFIGKVLDAASFVFRKIKNVTVTFYEKFIKGFVHAVQRRVKEIEKEKAEPSPTEEMELPAEMGPPPSEEPSMGMPPAEMGPPPGGMGPAPEMGPPPAPPEMGPPPGGMGPAPEMPGM